MRRTLPSCAALGFLVTAVALAGCSGAEAPPEAGDVADAAGRVEGVVVDVAIRPLAGATVSVPAQPGVAAATTDAEGRFALEGLAEGVAFLMVAKPGFLEATVQAQAGPGAPVVQVVLEPLLETQPYVVLESFRAFLDCGVGSGPAFGLSAGCMTVAGGALVILCEGGGPAPPMGVCLGGVNPYFVSDAQGNLTMAQTEAVWEPTVQGQSELILASYVLDAAGAAVGGAPSASGSSVLVRRLNETVVRDNALGGPNQLAIYLSPGNSGAANVVVQQAVDVYHTSAFHFVLPEEWTLAADGAPDVPDQCTVCA